ncbi:tandem-95 repeat protein [Stieleria sp. JC731]|uniref:tandem-95 repeat protein n=1 Tax=Pirellulaceae TaxID=2691357 RepID=UPI001E31027F|nr:tandem-95 repeat protein [Stieleria sp. JC731]MCC9601167.1 tandem-95 repeat protein [Stieleria sp. JC731]
MSFRRLGSRVKKSSSRQRDNKRQQSRQNLLQQLEDRRMLAGPELIAIRPDSGALLFDGNTLNVAPREFNLLFKGGSDINEATITSDSVKLVRSGGDGTFNDGNEVDVALGYLGLVNPGSTDASDLQQIVFRTASQATHNPKDPSFAFPDDTYQIQVFGTGAAPLSNRGGEAFADGTDFTRTFRLNLGAQVVSVIPQPISDRPYTQASDQIDVYFDNQELNPAQVNDPSYYRLVNTANSAADTDDTTMLPESVTYDQASNRVTLKFATNIPEGTYRLDIGNNGGDDSTLATAVQLGSITDGNPYVGNGFMGDANGISDDATDVDLYSMQLNAGSMLDVSTSSSSIVTQVRARLLDGAGVELADVTVPAGAAIFSGFGIANSGEYFLELSSPDGSTGAYGLNVSVSASPLVINDDNSTFGDATTIGFIGASTVRITSDISPQNVLIPPRAGSEDEPGHRTIQREVHTGLTGTTPQAPAPIRRVAYYFPEVLGFNSSGSPYDNLITEKEKQIVREIFEIYAEQSGYEFIEATGVGDLMIGKGDMRAVDPTLGPGNVAGLASGAFAVLDGSVFNDSNRFFGDGFTGVMFHEIAHSLGIVHSYDIPSNQGNGVPNDVLPGDHDIVHLQRIAPPNSTDIDMYEFTLDEAGTFKAETIAERLATPSLLDTALRLYREVNGEYELISQNDQYFGADSYMEVHLEPGTYFVGVSSTGNTNYDPNVPDSGFDGTTDGVYELQLDFKADRAGELADSTGVPIDGDGDGTPGGVYSFWFQASDVDTNIYVSKTTDSTVGPEGSGTLSNPYDEIDYAFEKAGQRIVIPVDGMNSIADGESFTIDDGTGKTTFQFGTVGPNAIDIGPATSAVEVAEIIEDAINLAKIGPSPALEPTVSVSVVGRTVQFSGINGLDIGGSATLLATPNIVHVLAHSGLDQDVDTLGDNRPYLVGFDTSGNPLADGGEFLVPQGVTAMVQAGALFKMRKANLDAGTADTQSVNRSHGAIQILGMPDRSVYMRSLHNDSVGGDSDGVGPGANSGDFGGIVFRDDSDLEDIGVFLNYVNHVDINNGGGKVFVEANELLFTPIYIDDARPTLTFNFVSNSLGAAISASPDSFDDSLDRIGPDVSGNFLQENTIDGMFIRVITPLGGTIDKLDVNGRFDDTDIPHVFTENLIINGAAGGPVLDGGTLKARAAGRLMVDPGVVIKLDDARIEVERGAGTLIAEGTRNRPVIFTSIADDRFGGSGSFDTQSAGFATPSAGDWSGIYFGQATSGSIDNAYIAYAGGSSPIEGGSASFNTVEIHQADVRIANSFFQNNADGAGGGRNANGRGANGPAVIYVRGAQPILLANDIMDTVDANNTAAAISINANSLNFETVLDRGRSTGMANAFDQIVVNQGPLVRMNRLENNGTNGMVVRGELLTTESVWDDTDMVHVLSGEVIVDNFHTYGGLKLLSSQSESLVIKFANANSGFTATGHGTETEDRIGGTVRVLGMPGKPVVMTSIADDTIGVGYTPSGKINSNTNNSATPTTGSAGDWRGLLFEEFSNDRNVASVREAEPPATNGIDINRRPLAAQDLGTLAPDEQSGDENRRLGFEIEGYISPNAPDDVDVYQFEGTAGTEVWIDIDRTDSTLDAIVEIVNTAGTVLARSIQSQTEVPNEINEFDLDKSLFDGGDHYTQNFRDPGLRYILPGAVGQTGVYFVRVRSNPRTSPDIRSLAGESSGKYQLQIRLRQIQEFPGSTVRYSDIRFASTAIDVRGLPSHSPLVMESGEVEAIGTSGSNDNAGSAEQLVNLLATDMAAIGLSGSIANSTDADWYQFELTQTGIQLIPGVNDGAGTIAVAFDIDYADGAVRADTTLAVYDENLNLVYVGREGNIEDDQQDSTQQDDLSRGSLGDRDPFIGPVHLTPGTESSPRRFYVAVMSDYQQPSALNGVFQAAAGANQLVRLEPINSVERIIEDHIGFQGYSSRGFEIGPKQAEGLFDITTDTTVSNYVKPFTLQDVPLYVMTDQPEDNNNFGDDDYLFTVDPFESSRWLTRVTEDGTATSNLFDGVNDLQDVVVRSDGRMYGYQRLNGDAANVGALVEIDPGTGATTVVGTDNINGQTPTPNTSVYSNQTLNDFDRTIGADQFTTSDEVDALTFRRIGQTGPASAPVPEYDIFYSVRESDAASKLYRATSDGDATLRRATTPTPGGATSENYGIVGDIQPAGVTYNTKFLQAVNPTNNGPQITNIRVKSKIAGVAGQFTISINRPGNNTNATVQGVNFGSNTIFIDIGANNNSGPTAQAIVDAINNHADASQLVTAVIFNGNANNRPAGGDGNGGTPAARISQFNSVIGSDGVDGPLQGRVTGLSYADWYGTGNLFGVTDAGEFLEIDASNATVINRVFASDTIGIDGLSFQGLALGPQNVEGGAYKNTLFAVTDDGTMVAFDTDGNGVLAFSAGAVTQQVVQTASGGTGGFFTLTTDAGGTGRHTTVPISVDSPGRVSVNEAQQLNVQGAGATGTFTLSFVDDVAATTSPAFDINSGDNFIFAEDLSDFPAAPFVIRVNNEEMLINGTAGNALFVQQRGYNGTVVSDHPDTATIFEVVDAATTAPISTPFATTISAAITPGALTVDVDDASGLPSTPFFARIQSEEVEVTDVTGNTLTIVRGSVPTTDQYHDSGRSLMVVTDTITVDDPVPFGTVPGFNIRVNGEEMQVTSVLGSDYIVRRAINGTVAANHNIGATVSRIQTTAPIAYNATTVQVENALEQLEAIGNGNVTVTGTRLYNGTTPGLQNIEFTGNLAARNVQPLRASAEGLIGDEIQQIAMNTAVTGGTFKLEFEGETTADIAFDATTADVQAALELLTTIDAGEIVLSGSLGIGSILVQFTGDRQDTNVQAITIVDDMLLVNEEQEVRITGNPDGGTFTLDIDDPTNGITGSSLPINYNDTAADVLIALQNIPGLTGNIDVTGGPLAGNAIVIEFIGTLAATDVAQFTVTNALTDSTGLTGPAAQVNTIQTINDTIAINEARRGTAVSGTVTTIDDGIISVLDALNQLSDFAPGDITAAGILPSPAAGVTLTFGGAYTGVTVPQLEVDNSLNVSPFSDASVLVTGTPADGASASFSIQAGGLNISGSAPVGIAFSPLDFNLWHPTTRRSGDAGHGINPSADDTRTPADAGRTYDTSGNSVRNFDEIDGGASWQFGFEYWQQNDGGDAEQYLRYSPGVNAQYGILTTEYHSDLSSNPAIVNGGTEVGSYNLPGGGMGSLMTNSFDLDGLTETDRPTLYFNYFLETENYDGSDLDDDDDDPFRDSARVFVSADGGLTWDLVATNNSQLSGNEPSDTPNTAELPGYLSRLADDGLNSADPRAVSQQIVQELFDNSGTWRQARVDLSPYAGMTGLMMRFDFSAAGSMNDDSLNRIDGTVNPAAVGDAAPYGEYASPGNSPRSIRSTNNQFEGFYIDDIIIGASERGEMATGTNSDGGITNLFAGSRTTDNDDDRFPDIVAGRYQLEIRRTEEYVLLAPDPTVGLTFDSNDRHIRDGVETATVSFEPATFVPDLTPNPGTEGWVVTAIDPISGTQSLETPNTVFDTATFEATLQELGSINDESGIIEFDYLVDSTFQSTGLRFLIDGVPQVLDLGGGEIPIPDPQLASGDTGVRTARFSFAQGNPTFTWVFDRSAAIGNEPNKAILDNIRVLQGTSGLAADRNRERPQGIFILDANRITDSQNVGVNIQPGVSETNGVPHPGALVNFPQLNADRYVPGIVVQNNVIAGSTGIRYQGEPNAVANRTVSFGRLLNNTLVGDAQSGTGIEIVGMASPTVMNNLITNYADGIINNGVGTIIRSNYFQDNLRGGAIGSAAIIGANGDPLFRDAANRNFYLVNGTQALDSAQITEQDRFDFLNFKTEIGIPASPILAPDRDQFGQLRVEQDSSPVADRGAIENKDLDAPFAQLLNPIDNDANDRDPSQTVVLVNDPLLDNFTILLDDGRGPNSPSEGTGVNGLTVDDPNDPAIAMQAVRVEQNAQPLVQGVDYTLAYNRTSGVLRLTPLSTLWEPSSIYVITLDNSLISDRAGNKLRSNQANGETRFTIIIPPVDIDYGDAPDSYGTLLGSDGARHTINDSRLPRLGVEIDGDSNGQPSVDATGDDFSGVDDEDGFNVGTFFGIGATDGLFLASAAANPTSNPADVVGFLNPNDAAGTLLSFDVVGDGVLDAWIDFNGDGDFNDFNEKVIDGLAVTDGANQARIVTPSTAVRGLTYARFRISENGVSDPTGIGIGGEVEDYRVRVLDVSATDAVDDDFYSVLEDHVLTVDGTNFPALLDNDVLPSEEFIQPRVVVNGAIVPHPTDTIYRTQNGQVRIDDAALGLFTYTPDPDFEGVDTFEYAVSTQRNEGPEFIQTADFATVSILVEHFNAPPIFDMPASVELNEDEPSSWVIDPFFMNVAGGDPIYGNDEGMENVTFSIVEVSSDPAGLMTQLPVITGNSSIEFFPAADQHGSVVYEITATDDGTPIESTTKTLTVSIRPINDAPRIDPSVINTGEVNTVDDAWSVAADGSITYTLREDNSPAVGQPVEEYFIPLNRDGSVSGYNPIGVLDVFVVGPPNEADPNAVGGNQTLSLESIPVQTNLGGALRLGTDGNGIQGIFYTPPKDYNNAIGSPDQFTYTVIDDGTSWQNGALVPDPKTSTNVVRFDLNPVNDRPEFDINLPPADINDPAGPRKTIETLEDASATLINNFVFNVAAGDNTSAFDEINSITGQSVTFAINPLDFAISQANDYFSLYPTISAEGIFEFRAAPDVFGKFDFEIVLTDNGPSDASRGDLTTSIPQTISIEVLPINDPPVVRDDIDPLEFTINEDGSVDIMAVGTPGNPGLLDVFAPGPDNESENIVPGGNQTVSLRTPVPTSSTFEGTIEEIRDNGALVGLRYYPKEDFVGTDTFTYTVTDDGVTVDFGTGGVEKADPKIATNTVKIFVNPTNDTPQFSGPANVVVDEDAGVVSVSSWANNVLAGPPSALDELETQDVFFTITQVGGDQGLFATPPTAVIDPVTRSASLDFETAPDANGTAILQVRLTDIPTDGTAAMSTAYRTFTVTVNPVNDIPTFDRVMGPITVLEDRGPYSEPWATNISPGPADESSQSVRFEVTTPTDAQALFQQLPTIGDDGVLRFLPAANANGTIDLTVKAIDSAGGESSPVVLRLVITPVNDIPVAVGDSLNTDEDAILTILESDLLANDIDPDINNPFDELSIVFNTTEFLSLSGAQVSYDAASGQITYDPSTSLTLQALSGTEEATDSFTYTVVDSEGEVSNRVTVTLTVAGINDAPVALNDAPTLNPNGPTLIDILANDSDVDGTLDPLTIEITLQPAFGSLSIDDDGLVTFNAFGSFAQEDVFRYRIKDNDGLFSDEATVTIQANAAPIAREDQAGTFLNEFVDINVVANDNDPDPVAGAPNGGLDLDSIQIVGGPLNGEAIPRGDGTVRYIPNDGFLGIDSFQYTIADSQGRVSSPGTVRVQVSGSRLQNPDLRTDVNDDGNVSPIDALLVINRLAREGTISIPVTNSDAGPPYYDVNGDQVISPADALAVINDLALRQAGGQGEGESVLDGIVDETLPSAGAMDFIDLMVDDDDEDEDRLNALDVAFGDLL